MTDFVIEWTDHDDTTVYKIYHRQLVSDLSIANRIYDLKVSAGIYDVVMRPVSSSVPFRRYKAPDDEQKD